MKKVIALMLCLLMVMSMAACGSQSATAEESNASTEQNETVTPSTEETEQQEETGEPEETQSAEPTFDTSWASNEFEALLPQPPFEMAGEQSSSDTQYNLSTESDVLDYSAESADRIALNDYVASLENYGFHIYIQNYSSYPDYIEAELPDSWIILDNLGNKFSIALTHDGIKEETMAASCQITIYCTNGTVVDTEALGGVFADLPDTIWTSNGEVTDTSAFLFTQYITHEAMTNYCDSLLATGYSITEEAEPYMSNISKTFTAPNGDEIYVQYEGKETFGTGSIGITLKKQETQVSTENETTANNSIDIEAVVLPALPEGNWEKEQFNDDTYIMTIESIEYAEIDKYIGELYEEDFSISEIEAYSGGYGEYQAEKGIGNTFIKVNIQYGNDGTDCRIAVTVKEYS